MCKNHFDIWISHHLIVTKKQCTWIYFNVLRNHCTVIYMVVLMYFPTVHKRCHNNWNCLRTIANATTLMKPEVAESEDYKLAGMPKGWLFYFVCKMGTL